MSKTANPFSTGSGGSNFENQVQTTFAVLMLSGGVSPCLPPWPIDHIKLQARWADFNIDDFIVHAQQPDGNSAKLLIQVKHSISFTEKDPELPTVLKAALTDYRNEKIFLPGRDQIALVTGPLSERDTKNVQTLLNWARTSRTSSEFVDKVKLGQFSSKAKEGKLQVFTTLLTQASQTPLTDNDVWEFLKSFHIFGLDLDEQNGFTRALMLSYLSQFQIQDVAGAWSAISREIAFYNQNGGTFTAEMASPAIKDFFKQRISAPSTMPKPLGQMTPGKLTAEHDSALMLASLIGSWDIGSDGDKEAIRKLLGPSNE